MPYVTGLEDLNLSSDPYLIDCNTRTVYRVIKSDVTFPPDDFAQGTVTLERCDGQNTQVEKDAKSVDGSLHDGTWRVVPPQVVTRADDVLHAFAEQEAQTYVTDVGATHDYTLHEVPSVDVVADVYAAIQLARHESP